jgi:RNA polymerase sigma-70 factor (family 1)
MRERLTHTEDEILTGFREGLEASFTAVFKALYPALCYYALRLTHDQVTAEDIAEESFIKVWGRRASFYHYGELKAYLYTTVRNASINWNALQKRQLEAERAQSAARSEYDSYVLEDMIRAEWLREVYTTLDTLPPQCLKIATMLYVEGKSTRQIAKELNLSVGTVKTQKARGLVFLRKRLTQTPYL